MLTLYKYCKILKVVGSEDGLVRKVIVEYRIPSLKKKEVCVDIRQIVILPNISLKINSKVMVILLYNILFINFLLMLAMDSAEGKVDV